MAKQKIIEVPGVKAIGPYSQAVAANGFLYVSGQGGIDHATGKPAGSTFAKQARQAFQNLGAVLTAGGSGYNRVVSTTVMVADMSCFPELNALYKEYFAEAPPARMAIQVVLPLGLLISIGCVALTGE